MSEFVTHPISLFLSNGGAVRVWNAWHVLWLQEMRIVGALIGSAVNSIQEKGLPLELLPEQAALLMEYGWAKLYADPSGQISDELIKQYEKDFMAKVEEYKNQRKIKSEKIKEFKMMHPAEVLPPYLLSPIQMPVETPTAADYYPWNQKPSEVTSWKWPVTDDEMVRFQVFKHLYEMGYYISRGSKFGGDYLLYEDFPENCHSDYIVSIAPPNQKLSSRDIVAMGRLGTAVKKTNVLCSWSKDHGFVSICLKWEGLA